MFIGDVVSSCHRRHFVIRGRELGKLFSIFLRGILIDEFSDFLFQSCFSQSLVLSSPDKASLIGQLKETAIVKTEKNACSMWPHKEDEQRSPMISRPYVKFIFRVLMLNLLPQSKRHSSWAVLVKVWFWLSSLSLFQFPLYDLTDCQHCVNFFWETSSPLVCGKFLKETTEEIPAPWVWEPKGGTQVSP